MALEYEIKKTITSVNDGMSDMNLELNLVSWNRRAPKYDIRRWSDDHTQMSKGLTLNETEVVKLFQNAGEVLSAILGDVVTAPVATEDDEPLPFE